MAEDAEKQRPALKSQESDYDRRSQSESETQSSATGSSVKGKQPAGEMTLNMSGNNQGTKKLTRKRDKKKVRRLGGVEKRKMTRRPRRKPKRRAPRARPSSSSFYAGRPSSSIAEVSEHICKYCGHRCCLRRYQNWKRQFRNAKSKRDKARKSPALRIVTADEGAQTGSRAAMLSTLFIKNNATAEPKEETLHCHITPEMIHLALRELTMWRQNVPTEAIFNYIRYNYPVHPNPAEVMTELQEKLHIASIAGLIWALPDDCWRLTTPLERINKLEQSHVTIFWKVYADTMRPLERNLALQLKRTDEESGTYSKEQVESGDADIV